MTTAFASGTCLTIIGEERSELLIFSGEVGSDAVQDCLKSLKTKPYPANLVHHCYADAVVPFGFGDKLFRQIVKPWTILVSMVRR